MMKKCMERPAVLLLLAGLLTLLSAVIFPVWVFAPERAEGSQALTVAGVSPEEALRLGERMYRDGILPSGESLQAVIKGDIAVDGKMFSCLSCHRRSGMGSYEGRVITMPINGPTLYNPLSPLGDLRRSTRERLPRFFRSGEKRSAYTDESLALAMRSGEDPGGRALHPVMPRYFLSDSDMEIMIFYLKNLSRVISPGVSDTTLYLATVITEDVSREDREAMLVPLRRTIESWGKSRQMELRAKKSPFTEERMLKGFRKMSLAVWYLKGKPESWRSQLEEYYRNGPVFALVGGITNGEWEPIHKFSEEHKIPSILPVTDLPVISDTDWYTLYFSKGLYQEGESAATYLNSAEDLPADISVVQVFRNNSRSLALSKAFQQTWEGFDRRPPENIMLAPDEVLPSDFWKRLTALHRNSVFLLWLGAEDLSAIESIAGVSDRPRAVLASASLLKQGLYSLPEAVRSFVYITYPYTLPQDEKRLQAAPEAWLRGNKIPVTDIRIQAKMYFISSLLTTPLTMMKSNYYRDYLLERIDMMEDQTYTIGVYPRLSFGPGQRYASKGCYIVQLGKGPQPELVPKSNWVIH